MTFFLLFFNELIFCDRQADLDLFYNIKRQKKETGSESKLKKLEQEFIKNVSQIAQSHLDRVAKLENRKFSSNFKFNFLTFKN